MFVSRSSPQQIPFHSKVESKFIKDLPLLTELLLKLKLNYEDLLNKQWGFKALDNQSVTFANIESIQKLTKIFCSDTLNTPTLDVGEGKMLREIIEVLNHPNEKQLNDYKKHDWNNEPNQKLTDEHQKLNNIVTKLLNREWESSTSQPMLTLKAKENLKEAGEFIFGQFNVLEENIQKYQDRGTYTSSGRSSLNHNISKLREILHRIKNAKEVPLQNAYELVQILVQHRVLIAHFAYYAVGGQSGDCSDHLWMDLPLNVKGREYWNIDNYKEIQKVNFFNSYLAQINSKIQKFIKNLNFPNDMQKELDVIVNAYLENPHAEKLCLEPEILNNERFEENSWIEAPKAKLPIHIIEQLISLREFVGARTDIEIICNPETKFFVFPGKNDFYVTGPKMVISFSNDNKKIMVNESLEFDEDLVKKIINIIYMFFVKKYMSEEETSILLKNFNTQLELK